MKWRETNLLLCSLTFFYCSLLANIRCISGVRLLKKDPIKVFLKIPQAARQEGREEEEAEGEGPSSSGRKEMDYRLRHRNSKEVGGGVSVNGWNNGMRLLWKIRKD